MMMGLYQGIQPLIGYNYTANRKRMNDVVKFSGICGAVLTAVIVAGLYFSASGLVGLFLDNTEIISQGTPLVRIALLSAFFFWITFLFTNFFQATGKSVPALVMSLSQAFIFIPALLIGNSLAGLTGAACALPAADMGCALLAVALYLGTRSGLKTAETDKKITHAPLPAEMKA